MQSRCRCRYQRSYATRHAPVRCCRLLRRRRRAVHRCAVAQWCQGIHFSRTSRFRPGVRRRGLRRSGMSRIMPGW
ncbi:hypothetical protein VTN31DRAFT_5683 [Thermomyces dupontii]|uniref:uncharacterized protein n=1 Tax=Talaromyces thermophilus TaxID=28565 RepID=UPI0037421737